jgi:hypothetical protein
VNILERLAQHGNRHLLAAQRLKKEIADLQGRIDGLEEKYTIPASLGLGDMAHHATSVMADEKRGLEREIAQRREAIAMCEDQARHNLGQPASYLMGPFELGASLNPSMPEMDQELRSACLQAELVAWQALEDNPAFARDGQPA